MSEQPLENKQAIKADEMNASEHANVSQVTPEANAWQKKIIHGVILLTILFVVLFLLFAGGHASHNPHSEFAQTNPNFNGNLDKNESKLKQGKGGTTPPTPPAPPPKRAYPPYFSTAMAQPMVSKEYLARQNAPTVMFSGSDVMNTNPGVTTASASNATASQAPFAGQDDYSSFGNQSTTMTTISATTMAHPDFTIASGEFMHATLETAVNSDLPGMVRAVLEGPVYAYVGERPLIPKGSRLIGQYSSNVFQGMTRLFVVWNRVILPNGVTVQINSPGTDALGRAGMGADAVNNHFFARFGQSALLSIIGAGAANFGVGNEDQYNSASMYRAAVAQSFQQSAKKSLQDNSSIKPTLHIYQGAQINVFVAHDLDFYTVLMKNKV